MVVVAVILALGSVVVLILQPWRPRPTVHLPALPAGETYGIDVSHHQGKIDWGLVAADRIAFAYVKASEGTSVVDARFEANAAGASRAGLRVGAYHFFSLCGPGNVQARTFLAAAPPDAHQLAPALDVEFQTSCPKPPGRAQVMAQVQAFLTVVEKAWGRPVLIYTNDDFNRHYPVRGLGRPLWIPRYGHRPPTVPAWVIWQSSEGATLDGVTGPVDLDVAAAAA